MSDPTPPPSRPRIEVVRMPYPRTWLQRLFRRPARSTSLVVWFPGGDAGSAEIHPKGDGYGIGHPREGPQEGPWEGPGAA